MQSLKSSVVNGIGQRIYYQPLKADNITWYLVKNATLVLKSCKYLRSVFILLFLLWLPLLFQILLQLQHFISLLPTKWAQHFSKKERIMMKNVNVLMGWKMKECTSLHCPTGSRLVLWNRKQNFENGMAPFSADEGEKTGPTKPEKKRSFFDL